MVRLTDSGDFSANPRCSLYNPNSKNVGTLCEWNLNAAMIYSQQNRNNMSDVKLRHFTIPGQMLAQFDLSDTSQKSRDRSISTVTASPLLLTTEQFSILPPSISNQQTVAFLDPDSSWFLLCMTALICRGGWQAHRFSNKCILFVFSLYSPNFQQRFPMVWGSIWWAFNNVRGCTVVQGLALLPHNKKVPGQLACSLCACVCSLRLPPTTKGSLVTLNWPNSRGWKYWHPWVLYKIVVPMHIK